MNTIDERIERAGILTEALPYIQKLYSKTIVIKYGGNAMINEDLKRSVMEDITLLKYVGMNPVIVHGGGPDISESLKTYHIESKFVSGLRVTDAETMRIAQMVLVGKTNKEVVSNVNRNGGKAIGLCGIDGKIIECEPLTEDSEGNKIDVGFVGKIKKVNAEILKSLCEDEYIPVIAPIGTDDSGQSYNINADTVASAVATAMGAEKLMFLTDVEGVKDAKGDIIFEITTSSAEELIHVGTINGGMIPKVRACVKAVLEGVNRVHIIDGRVLHSIILEIFTDTGIGTMFKKG
ncbi:MAG TPA: acetylglutamate kinase [Clostridiales bacterium]|jgi:acetylglutamate kinase|uniref:Acetylglutamate kinase n=1 Tax=Congzhengia minquanensis TaxID=2763657 RepID=A0A926DJV5_9FIRM|nr:acetylglutamate kinase [Congzhengia minquanensis]MBC8540265.1 acetylglutamate kinase [Congzhengia minquanensis]MBD8947853.1 acetylglutamate kinase [Clostridiales bacterium]MBD8948057.1 acetylglutamate kinase [Clostridiales bacterium]HBL83041.1 acetylglutamate kinase [Clostridiales bacterium]